MIDTLISSKTRVKLLLKFFLNSNTKGYLRSLAEEFNESTNAIRVELNRLEQANMIEADTVGNKKVYQANTKHPLFNELQNIVRKHMGIDEIISNVANNLGKLQAVYLTGGFAQGLNSECIELIFVGDIDVSYLNQLVQKTECLIGKKIKSTIIPFSNFKPEDFTDSKKYLLCWSAQNKN